MNVYFISGMGADRRLFKNILLPEGFQMNFVEWIRPEDDEPIPAYASRLATQIDTSHPFILAGVSLGGIMSVEIAKLFPPVATIIIGSIPVARDLPRYYHTLGQSLGLLKVLPGSFFKRAASAKRWFTRETKADKRLIWQMIRESDARFLAYSWYTGYRIPHPAYASYASDPAWRPPGDHDTGGGGECHTAGGACQLCPRHRHAIEFISL
jgi:hypothetical protein